MAPPLARSVLVTGSSRGLGLEMVRQLATADNPPQVIIATCRNPDKATALQALARDHKQIKVIQFDVVDYESLPRLVSEVKAAVGDKGLNLVVNNAGVLESCDTQKFGVSLEALEPQMFRSILETNTIAPLMIVKALLPQLKVAVAAGGEMGVSRAAIVNISSMLGSMAAYINKSDIYAYRCSKAALNMQTKTLAEQLGLEGLLFVSLCPGWVRTDMGTSDAMLSVDESVSSIFRVMRNLNKKHNGALISNDGNIQEW